MGKVKKKGAGAKGGKTDSKALSKLAKKQKQQEREGKKVEKKGKKSKSKASETMMEEADFIASLEEHRLKWQAEHAVSEDVVDGPPSRRANATLTPCPVSNHLWLFGGGEVIFRAARGAPG